MNILPKKRWHVRTKDNIARVRKDEAQAADEENERLRRVKLAEQESRTALLRQQARSKNTEGDVSTKDINLPGINKTQTSSVISNDGDTPKDKHLDSFSTQIGSSTTADIYTKDGNINFFKDLESGLSGTGSLTNKEREAEELAEKEKYEKQIGLLTYLGQDSLESNKTKAWYHDEEHCVSALVKKKEPGDSANSEAIDDSLSLDTEENGNLEVGLKAKNLIDPLNDMIKLAGWKPSKSFPIVISHSSSFSPINDVHKIKVDKHVKKREKSKKTKKSKSRRRSESDSSDSSSESRTRSKKRKRKSKKDDNSRSSHSSSKKRQHSDRHRSSSSHKKRSRSSKSKRSRSRNEESSSGSDSDSSDSDDREKRQKLQNSSSLASLRKERLEREATERLRAQRLLNGQDPDTPTTAPKPEAVRQKYSSQFNPTIARQNKEENMLKSGVKYF